MSLSSTPYLTDTFNRANTSPVSGANSTTGVGNGWLDRVGGVFSINSDLLTTTAINSFQTEWLTRPLSENSLLQRIVIQYSAGGSTNNQIPMALLRVDSANDNAYVLYYDYSGTLTLATILNGTKTVLRTATFSYSSSASYILDFTVIPNSPGTGSNLTGVIYAASAPTTALATVTVTGDTTAGLQSALSYGLTNATNVTNGTTASSVQLYTTSSPSLAVTPSTTTAAGGQVISLTATLLNSAASLSATVSGGGTISTSAPTSGTAFTYTAPSSGSGTATITVTDSTDSLVATSTIYYSPATVNGSPYLTDTFNRANTSPVSGANSTTGVGNGWLDRVGGVFSINSDLLTTTAINSFQTEWLTRAIGENSLSQRIVAQYSASSNSANIPMVLLRVDSSNDNCYALYYDTTGTLTLVSLVNGTSTHLRTGSFSYSAAAAYILDLTVVPNASGAGTNLTGYIYNAAAPSTALATVTVTGDTTPSLQKPGSYGLTNAANAANAVKTSSVQLYNASTSPSLAVTPSTTTTVDGQTVSIVATLINSSASLSATVSGGGTISTSAPTSGTAFTYTAPSSGSGTATITTTDSTDSLTATSVISYAPAPLISCAPTSFPLGVATPFTLTGVNTAWTSSTMPLVSGGTNAYISNIVVSGQTITGTLLPGSQVGPLTITDSTDSASTTVTAVANITTNIVWDGTSLTEGSNGSNPYTVQATRLAQVMAGMGPTVQGSNQGVGGQQLTTMISRFADTIVPLFVSGMTNYLVAEGGHNDFATSLGNKSVAQVIALIQQYVAQALASFNGLRIIWCTEPPAAYPNAYPALFDSMRDSVNTFMRANWRTMGIYALSDFAANAQMGPDGSEYNSTLFSGTDFTHPTDAGYTIWGKYDLAAIQSPQAGLGGRSFSFS